MELATAAVTIIVMKLYSWCLHV